MATVLEELLIQIGVDVDERSLNKLDQTSEKVAKTLNRVAVAGAAAAAVIVAYTSKMANAADASIKFARMTGIAFDSIQELEFAAQREGAGVGELTSNLEGLTQVLGQLAIGRGPQEAVRRLGGLGLTLSDLQSGAVDAEDLFLRIGEAIKGMTKLRQIELTSQLGITSGTLKLLQQGRASIDDLRKAGRDYGLETLESAKLSEKLQDSILGLRRSFDNALLPLRKTIVEFLTDVIDGLSKWIKENKELIKELTKLTAVLGVAFVVSKIVKWGAAIASVTKLVWGLVAAKTALGAIPVGGAAAAAGSGGSAAGSAVASVAGGAALPIGGLLTAFAGISALGYLSARNKGIPGIGGNREIVTTLPNGGGSKAFEDNRRITFNITEATDANEVARIVNKELEQVSRDGSTEAEPVIF